jgi:hypothetical protein
MSYLSVRILDTEGNNGGHSEPEQRPLSSDPNPFRNNILQLSPLNRIFYRHNSPVKSSIQMTYSKTPPGGRGEGLELVKHKKRTSHQAAKRSEVVPMQLVAKVKGGEDAEHGQRNHLLNHLELVGTEGL